MDCDKSLRIEIDGRVGTLRCCKGDALLFVLQNAGIVIDAPCGGRGLCGKCRVKLLSGSVEGVQADGDGFICACKARVIEDIRIRLESGAVFENEVRFSLNTAAVKAADVALDIGTTTVSAALVDRISGAVLGSKSVLNPQRVYGADVLSRITACKNGNAKKLTSLIKSCVKEILCGFIEQFALEKIERLYVAGNTVMMNLFAEEDVSAMGQYPFTPPFLSEKLFAGGELGLPADEVRLLPSLSPFIGADTVAAVYQTDLQTSLETAMLLDVGTNCEIALKANGKLYFCSAAAGPALEGAQISCGTGAVEGAISGVTLERGKIGLSTIGGAAPKGLCGAGLIDAVALLRRAGLVSSDGAITDEDVRKSGFSLAEGVTLLQNDIRQYQLAKSAVVSAIELLCAKAGIRTQDVSRVYMAGGLGFYLSEENAVYTGLLPKAFAGKTISVGNASLLGCIKLLRSGEGAEITCVKEIVDLNAESDFEKKFIENTAISP